MIREMVDEVELGQPRCLVFGHSFDYAVTHLLPKAKAELARRRIPFRRVSRNEIDANGTSIVFLSTKEDSKRLLGIRASRYYDHYAVEESPQLSTGDSAK